MANNNLTSEIPKVSIGLTVYNGGEQLRVAINSLLSQDFTDFELIISDNASTDGTEALCREYAARDRRIRYLRRDRNYGMLNNVKNVVNHARGAYFMPAAHDDEWMPQYISKCVERLDANPSLVVVSPAIEFFRPDGSIVDIAYPPICTVGMGIRDRIATIFHEHNVGYNIYGIIRRDALQKIVLEVDCYACDVVHLIQLMFLGEIDHIPEKLFRFCFVPKTAQQHAANISKELGDKSPTKLYTILTINLFRAIINAPIEASLKRVLISDALSIITLKNLFWRQKILLENPGLLRFLEPKQNGYLPAVEINLISGFAALLLPYCYPNAPYEGAIDFSAIEGFDAIPQEQCVPPAPGHREYVDTLSQLLANGMCSQALAFHDEFRGRQPGTALVRKLSETIEMVRPKPKPRNDSMGMPRSVTASSDRMRIVLQDCSGSSSGWDSLIQKQLRMHLTALGHDVLVDANDDSHVTECDIVHAFALTRAQDAERMLNKALRRRVPFVITTLLDDQRQYRVKAKQQYRIFKKYVEQGQHPDSFEKISRMAPSGSLALPEASAVAARYAHRLLACGTTESRLLETLFPFASIDIVPFGTSGTGAQDSGTLFEKEYGVKDVVLCVADLEIINNQCMLLKALEHEDVPVVFIDGGSIREPEYATLCKRIRRKGPTIFVSGPTGEMLLSAYHAARVFCFPGWYDMPGLATLEAARQGCAIVASSWGCVRDYLGDRCEYCEPDSPESVRNAVLRAYEEGSKEGLKDLAASFSWEASAKKLEEVYYEIVG